MIISLRKSRFYKPLLYLGASICLILIFWLGTKIVGAPKWIQIDDYVEYWSAGQLNLYGGNPYSPEQLLPLQLDTGRTFGVPVMMWNPPWMMLISMPFSVISYPISRVMWIIFFVILIIFSVNMTWQTFGGDRKFRWIAWLVGLSFLPILEALKTGQTGPLLLLGAAGYLYFVKQNKLWLAGVLLSLLMIKPHILYLVLFSVLLWSIYEKQYRILLGMGFALIFATLIAWIANPNVIQQYFFAIANYPPQDWATPTIGGIVRFLAGPDLFWLQFLPPLLGGIWLFTYWFRNRNNWDWIEQTPLIILVSIFTAAYGWTSDQSASLIPILQIFILLIPINFRNKKQMLVLCSYIGIEVLLFIPLGNQLWNFWVAPTILIWYLLARSSLRSAIK